MARRDSNHFVINEEVDRSVGNCKTGGSPLHYLYPGHPMRTTYDLTRGNVPNEFESELDAYVKKENAMTQFHHQTVNDVEKKMGGQNKIFHHPAVAPDQVTENPELGTSPLDLPSASSANPGVSSEENSSEGFGYPSKHTKESPKKIRSRRSYLGLSIVAVLILIIFLGILFVGLVK